MNINGMPTNSPQLQFFSFPGASLVNAAAAAAVNGCRLHGCGARCLLSMEDFLPNSPLKSLSIPITHHTGLFEFHTDIQGLKTLLARNEGNSWFSAPARFTKRVDFDHCCRVSPSTGINERWCDCGGFAVSCCGGSCREETLVQKKLQIHCFIHAWLYI